MNDGQSLPEPIRAEAAAWLARLHADDRTASDEAGLRDWLAADGRHRQAFDLVTHIWDSAGGVSLPVSAPPEPRFGRRAVMAGGLLAAAASVGGIVVARWPRGLDYATERGEQRRIALADGSNLLLDTDTRLHVDFSETQRSIRLDRGRAHFQVASDPLRPFVVRAGDRQVVAIGTAFDVVRDLDRLSVVLVEGKVAVARSGAPAGSAQMMIAGQRFTAQADRPGRVDTPTIDRLVAWQSGRAMFEQETLASAVAQMNRYSRRPLLLADPALGAMKVSGVYDTGNVEAFAQSVSLLLSLPLRISPEEIVLGEASGDLRKKV